MDGWLRGQAGQQLRIAAGIILFGFVALHLLNHAAGLISLDAMVSMQWLRTGIARSWVGSALLGGALIVHTLLSLVQIAGRSTWRMDPEDATQIALGLLIPFLLLPHVVETRVAHQALGVNDTYLYELLRLWPNGALWQTVLLVVVWAHGCIGIHYWLRTRPDYRRFATALLLAAVILPLAALVGFMEAGRAVAALTATPEDLATLKDAVHWPDDAGDALLARVRGLGYAGIWLGVAALGAAVGYRLAAIQRAPKIKISYLGGPTVSAPLGPTLLEISRMHGIPHAAICGGRSRCSTCRVRIDRGAEHLPPPDVAEAATLASINAPPNVRLACQLRPRASLKVVRLLPPGMARAAAAGETHDAEAEGVERVLVLMFLDVRSFTQHMERKLPYDVVYILNEFFAATGRAITSNGGVIDKFLGDGLLAVFGRRNGPEEGAREALQAARAIDLALDQFNASLSAELSQPLDVGIGIHAGPLLLGRIGWGSAVDITVIGHTVNAASRLEALTKPKACQLVISREVADFAGWRDAATTGESIQVRGVAKPIEIICVSRGRDLPPQILGPGWSG